MIRKNTIEVPEQILNAAQETWSPILEKFLGTTIANNTSPDKINEKMRMLSAIAHNQKVYGYDESLFEGVNKINEHSSFDSAGVTTLSNTPGVGNPSFGTSLGGYTAFNTGTPGSGDKWLSPLDLSLQVAAKTVGLECVEVIPINNPVGMVYYVDYIYADGKLDGTGNDAPKLFRIAMPSGFTGTKGTVYIAGNSGVGTGETLTGTSARLEYVGKTRIDGYAIFKLLGIGSASGNAVTDGTTGKIADVFDGTAKVFASTNTTTANTLATAYTVSASADYVNAFEDHVYGFSNGYGGQSGVQYAGNWLEGDTLYQGARRGESEADAFTTMGMKVYNRNIECEELKVAFSVTQQQLQDMRRQHGFDILAKVENALINETTQTINKSLVARMMALGWTNHFNASNSENINMNLALDSTHTSTTTKSFIDNTATSRTLTIPVFATYSTSTASMENQDTIHRRLVTKIGASSAIINMRGRRGQGTFIITNSQLGTVLMNNANYTTNPFDNTLKGDSSSLYPAGKVLGMQLYIDPNMTWDDTRVLVGRKGGKDEPGLKFLPYLLGESVQTISPETMSPKIALFSRFAIIDYGQHPETQYMTFWVKVPTGGIV